jgi:serine/threonine protein kinase
MFSLGLVIFTMVTGSNPFLRETDDATRSRNAKGSLPEGALENKSTELQSFIQLLCKVDPRKRYTASEASSHQWLEQIGF